MKKPYICFCGDEDKCRELMNVCKEKIRAVFITERNYIRLLDRPLRHPALICLIFRKDSRANDELYRKIYSYCAFSRCPLHVIGSRRNFETIERLTQGTFFQRSSIKLMLMKINEICDYAARNRKSEFSALKSRFETVVVISDKTSTLSLCESKASDSPVKPRVIIASADCSDKEYELIQKEEISEIITDKPLNSNSLKLFEKVSKAEAPAIILDRNESYGRKISVQHLSSKDDSEQITELLTEYSKKHSKLMYIRNK